MPFYFKCSRCRTRHRFTKHPEAYKRAQRCKVCDREKYPITNWYLDTYRHPEVKKEVCRCGMYIGRQGYQYPHRPGSRLCILNPHSAFWHAVQRGDAREEDYDRYLAQTHAGRGLEREEPEVPGDHPAQG